MPIAIPLPYSTGSYLVTQGFDTSFSHRGHLKWGIDFGLPYGTAVNAILSGEIVAFRQNVAETFIEGPADQDNPASAGDGLGNFVTIRSTVNGNDLFTTYAHMAPNFLSDSLGIDATERPFSENTVWGTVGFGEDMGVTGATGIRFTTRPEIDGAARGAHLHLHMGTEIVETSLSEWQASGMNDAILPVYFGAFGIDSNGIWLQPSVFSTAYPGSDFATFLDANEAANGSDPGDPPVDESPHDQIISIFTDPSQPVVISDIRYTGSPDAIDVLPDGLSVTSSSGNQTVNLGPGIVLSTGALPVGTQAALGFPGDPQLDQVAQEAFSGAGQTFDAAILDIDFEIVASLINADDWEMRLEFVFASQEYPNFIDSPYVDVAGIFVNGQNVAYLDDAGTVPLSVTSQAVGGYFIDNTSGEYNTPWNGFTGVQSVRFGFQDGLNNLRVGIADTGDQILDSGIYVSNLQLVPTSGSGGGILGVLQPLVGGVVNLANFAQEVILGSFQYTLNGTPQSHNGNVINGFGSGDILSFEGVSFGSHNITVTYGSLILEMDTDQDGDIDTTVFLAGDYSSANVLVEQVDDDTNVLLNFAPVAEDDAFETQSGVEVTGNVLANDSDPDGDELEVASFTYTGDGTLEVESDGSFTYLPAVNFSGTSSFSYIITDGFGGEDSATVTIEVEPFLLSGIVLDVNDAALGGIALQHSSGVETTSGADGRFSIEIADGGTGLLTASGSAPEGTLSMEDGAAVLRAAMGLTQLDSFEFIAADVNRDGVVNAADAQMIFRHLSGLDTDGDPEGFALIDANGDYSGAQLSDTGYAGGVETPPMEDDLEISLIALTLGQMDQFDFA
ncbi:MAG: hypothetical protein EA353_13655 [Puniceicoccaceae bacterium]|nr:MAG: hypothetical protein EA353_13655 [Puniceicoccaceae bacterium]